MLLTFSKPFHSINTLEPINLPDFTILTGLNGSGKTHILQGIVHGHINISGLHEGHIAYYNQHSFRLSSGNYIDKQTIEQDNINAWEFFQSTFRIHMLKIRNTFVPNISDLELACKAAGTPILNDTSDTLIGYKEQITFMGRHPSFRGNEHIPGILAMCHKLPYLVDKIEKEAFFQLYRKVGSGANMLSESLSSLFWSYYCAEKDNLFYIFENETQGTSNKVLTPDEFKALHGPRPWELINELLGNWGNFSFRVCSPENMRVSEKFQARTHNYSDANTVYDINLLSSGEQILLSLVVSVLRMRYNNAKLDVLLLDEVDAMLHPSMIKNLFYVIKDVFLTNGSKVILATHSPTTVALAEDDSVFVVHRAGRSKIEKTSKSAALNILTEGYVTLDKGLILITEVAHNAVNIITEGHNIKFLKLALELDGVNNIHFVSGMESGSGKSQLFTLFDFFSKIPHDKKVVFVWDNDYTKKHDAKNNTFQFTLPHNTKNTLATNGIENMFEPDLMQNFLLSVHKASGKHIVRFDTDEKNNFAEYILSRREINDFTNFKSFVDFVNDHI